MRQGFYYSGGGMMSDIKRSWILVGSMIQTDGNDRERKTIAVTKPKGAFGMDETQEANAHLIAAAPDLLEACKYAFENLKPQGNVKKDFSGHNAMATLLKAIRKATQEEPEA
jgi:hypothetical protein